MSALKSPYGRSIATDSSMPARPKLNAPRSISAMTFSGFSLSRSVWLSRFRSKTMTSLSLGVRGSGSFWLWRSVWKSTSMEGEWSLRAKDDTAGEEKFFSKRPGKGTGVRVHVEVPYVSV